MDAVGTEKKTRDALVDSLIKLGTEAFKPGANSETKKAAQDAFESEIQRTGTLALIPVLNTLIQPGKVPPWLQEKFMASLTRIPLRPGGVRATVEFVFSVHPSSTVGAPEEGSPQKQGANITQEALAMATRLLGNPPSGMTPDDWFLGISPQLFALLDGQDGPELMKVASYVIGFGILGRRQFGAPGSAGWKAFAEPMLRPINPSVGSSAVSNELHNDKRGHVVDLSKDTRLFTARELSVAVSRLLSLLMSHPNPGLSRRLISPVVPSLWAITSWPNPKSSCEKTYCVPARNLLKIYLQTTTSPDKLSKIIKDILFNGESRNDRLQWKFQETLNGDIQVIRPRPLSLDSSAQFAWNSVETKADTLLDLFQSVSANEEISSVFLELFSRHFAVGKPQNVLDFAAPMEEAGDALTQFVEAKVLQKMMERYPEQLVSRPTAILEVVEPILKGETSGEEDETHAVALSLVNLVMATPQFQKSKVDEGIIQSLETSLDRLAKSHRGDVSVTARNLSLLLRYRDELHDSVDEMQGPTDRQKEERKTYQLAMSYITQPDSAPPVRSEGLNLLQQLISSHSPVVDIPAMLVLMSSLLEDNEDYINLRVIKIFIQIANKHPRSTTKELLDHYVDANETATVDTRLRFGEALLQVIERLGETFTGETAQQVSQALLSTAGRREYRPKTEQKQAREERLRKMKQRQAENAWGGEVPDLAELAGDLTEEEVARDEIMSRIVGGWESKRGSEDVRIRASALSIFGAAIETNIVGIGSTLVSGSVDLAVNILTMEPEMEKGILRRSAVLLILSFVKALDNAKQTGRRLGFGLTEESQEDINRVLNYIAGTDHDGLVKQHALDVVESLENLRMGSLISEAQHQGPTLTKLAGLDINPDRSAEQVNQPRPRIEEIE